jgi:hypothetical protein
VNWQFVFNRVSFVERVHLQATVMCSARTSAQVAADDRVLEPHTVPVGGQYALMHQGVNGVWYVSYGDAVDRKVARVAQQPRDS